MASLTIGDFSKATHLSVKTLRHYHATGLLEPAVVDPATGYRRYRADQIPTAQVIRRFRALDMPLGDIRAVLAAPDAATRNARIASHLDRLEGELARTQEAVASLRDLLQAPGRPLPIGLRRVAPTPAAVIAEVVRQDDLSWWFPGALAELRATLAAQGVDPVGVAGGLYDTDLFARERGGATVFIPADDTVRPVGRVGTAVIPAVELATIVHVGPHTDIDIAYGTLGGYVARHALAVDGPIREYYPVDGHDTVDESRWRTEIGWPVFDTRGGDAD